MKKRVTVIGQCALLLLLTGACDSFVEDVIPFEKQILINPDAGHYYVLSNAPTLIDLNSLISSAFTDFSIEISESPSRGTLSHLGGPLLRYVPFPSFKDGQDRFVIQISTNSAVITERIDIHMHPDISVFPCALYALQDIKYATPGVQVSISALANDRVCGVPLEDVEISLSVHPKHGRATISDQVITYLSEPGFDGTDEIVYKISAESTDDAPESMVSYALVNVYVSDNPCPFFVLDTYTLDLTDSAADPLNTGECGGGYDIPIWGIITPPCARYGYYIKQISQSGISGSLCFGSDGGMSYKPDPVKIPKNEVAKLELCVNGECKEVTIDIVREKPG